jgi:hypothetical protein
MRIRSIAPVMLCCSALCCAGPARSQSISAPLSPSVSISTSVTTQPTQRASSSLDDSVSAADAASVDAMTSVNASLTGTNASPDIGLEEEGAAYRATGGYGSAAGVPANSAYTTQTLVARRNGTSSARKNSGLAPANAERLTTQGLGASMSLSRVGSARGMAEMKAAAQTDINRLGSDAATQNIAPSANCATPLESSAYAAAKPQVDGQSNAAPSGCGEDVASYSLDFPDSTRGTALLSPPDTGTRSPLDGAPSDLNFEFADFTRIQFLTPTLHVTASYGSAKQRKKQQQDNRELAHRGDTLGNRNPFASPLQQTLGSDLLRQQGIGSGLGTDALSGHAFGSQQ